MKKDQPKQNFRQIFHVKTKTGWEVSGFHPKTLMTQTQANNINEQFSEHGRYCVPQDSYERFLANSRLLN